MNRNLGIVRRPLRRCICLRLQRVASSVPWWWQFHDDPAFLGV